MISNHLKYQLAESYKNFSHPREQAVQQDWKIYEHFAFLKQLQHEGKKTLLEIGAGPGKDSLFFKDQGLDVLTTDLSEEMIERCRAKGLEALVMSADQLQFEPESFDAVWALNCLLHVPNSDLEEVLAGIKRVLRREGLFYLGTYGGIDQEGVWENDFHQPKRYFSFHTEEAMSVILRRHFTIQALHKIPLFKKEGPTHFYGFILRN